MRANECKTCQTCHDLDCSWGLSQWTEKLGGVWTRCPPSPALPSPYIVLIIIRIQCVLVQYITVVIGMLCTAFSYRLTQLNGVPCLICSGSFILILYWKGIVNTVWRRDERGEGRRGWKREKGGWILPSVHFSTSLPILPFFLSLFSLMSVLSIGSKRELVAIIYTHTVTLYYAHIAIAPLILWPSVCLYHWLVEKAGAAFKGTEIVGIHYVVTKKSFIEMI